MKAEIYSVVDKSFNPKLLDKKMVSVTNQLREADIEILYKTDLESDKIKLLEALRQSYATDEGIQLVIIANALDGTSSCDTIQLFKKLCPKHTESSYDEDEEADFNDKNNISEYKSKNDLEELATEFEIDTKAIKKASSKKNKKKSSKSGKKSSEKVINEIWSTGDLGKGYEGCFMLYADKLILALPKESLTKVSTADMIIAGAKKATSARGITTGNLVSGKITDHFDYYTIAQNDYKAKKKKGFVASVIPCKGDSAVEVTRKIILMLASATFIVTAVILCKLLFIEPAQVEDNYDDLRDIFHDVAVNSDTDTASTDTETEKPDRFAQLQAINPEIKGWIYIPNTTYIDYPVLEHEGDGPYSQYYLYRDYKGNASNYGSVFLDYRCEKSVNSKNVILHGHNMDNGMVFHQLLSYSNLSFYQSAPVIQFDTAEYEADWKIISVFKTNTLTSQGEFFNYLRGEFENDTEFMDFVYNVLERSIIDTGVTVNEDDQLLTLSTCSYEFKEFRTVIVARRVREGEDASVDIAKATMNPDAVWPQCYYAKNGGAMKELTDFVTAFKEGQASWYDGDFKLDGKDIRKEDSDTDTDTDTETDTEEEESSEEEDESSEEEEESSKEESSSKKESSSSRDEESSSKPESSEPESEWYEPEPSSSEEESERYEPSSSEPESEWYEPEPSSSEPESEWYEPEPSSSEPESEWYEPSDTYNEDTGYSDYVEATYYQTSYSNKKYADTVTRRE